MSTAAGVCVEPVVKSVEVSADPARAFEVFTAGMGRWWLPTDTINPTESPIAAVVMEPRKGGRWYERGEDGSQCEWGRMLAWEPPARIVLAWQIGPRWNYDPDLVTEVVVRFEQRGPARTVVRVEHRNSSATATPRRACARRSTRPAGGARCSSAMRRRPSVSAGSSASPTLA